jgi:hypothetical protein
MRRRLPNEPKQLIEQLTSWIEWRHSGSKEHLVLTSAPTSVPRIVERWMPGAVWRLAWLRSGAAVLYGLAPSSGPGKYFVVKHDAVNAQTEGVFSRPTGLGAWWRATACDPVLGSFSKLPNGGKGSSNGFSDPPCAKGASGERSIDVHQRRDRPKRDDSIALYETSLESSRTWTESCATWSRSPCNALMRRGLTET